MIVDVALGIILGFFFIISLIYLMHWFTRSKCECPEFISDNGEREALTRQWKKHNPSLLLDSFDVRTTEEANEIWREIA